MQDNTPAESAPQLANPLLDFSGMPRFAGGIPINMKRPSVRLSATIARSPCSTCISTAG